MTPAWLHAAAELEQQRLIDWRQSARAKMSVFRRLFEDFSSTDLAAGAATPLATDFAQFRAAGGTLLAAHARFEALHAAKFAADASAWNWHDWSEPWRNPGKRGSDKVRRDECERGYVPLLSAVDRRSFVCRRAARDKTSPGCESA